MLQAKSLGDLVVVGAGALLRGEITQRDFNMIRYMCDVDARKQNQGTSKGTVTEVRGLFSHASDERAGSTHTGFCVLPAGQVFRD